MNVNKNAISKLLKLNDEELARVISEIADEAGIDRSKFSTTPANMKKLRLALSLASAEEISSFIEQLKKNKN